jgi:4-amino-4-deoxy-L-arabinose transferase-like glycosyltransferase
MRSVQFNFSLFPQRAVGRLSLRSRAILLLFGLTILLINLGAGRVLTRHEVFAAEPGREMIHFGTLSSWMLPMLAGVPRTAKPPGMMWLIAASIYIFRDTSAWVARLPSALAAMWVALMIARLTARWFGDRLGRIAGLVQLTSVYTLLQAKLAEADMCLVAAVCLAMCSFAVSVIDSPAGLDERRGTRLKFWLAAGAAFLLKGPIGLIFILLTIAAFAWARRRGPDGRRDGRVLRFLADPLGIACFLIMLIVWPLLAWRLDPTIVQSWVSEMAGSATGRWETDPIYYYVFAVPIMLLPWLPLTIIGIRRGPNAELAGAVVSQSDRAMLWRFLFCWFIPGILFLTFCMRMKHHHYSMPILVPLSIPTALGLDYFVRRQTSRPQLQIWPFILAGGVIAILLVGGLHPIRQPLKSPLEKLFAILTLGALISLRYERLRRPNMVLASYFLTAWAVAIGVQSWIMPVQDDYKFQTDFARAVNGSVPPGATIYMLGHREEEQEAQYAYYLRFPMQRLNSAEDFLARRQDDQPLFAIAPAGFLPEIAAGKIQVLSECTGLRPKETEADRLCLIRVGI